VGGSAGAVGNMAKHKITLGVIVVCLWATSMAPSSQVQGEKSPVGPEDLFLLREVSDVQLSPTGTRVAFVLTSIDKANDREFSNIWIIPASGGPMKQLTEGEFSDSSPRWSPDGHQIAFSSNRGGRPSLWVVDAETFQARMLTPWARSNFFISKPSDMLSWSPDGQKIAFAAAESGTTPQSNDPRVVTRIQYKSRTSFSDDLHTQLFTISIADGIVRQLTRGKYDVHSITWSSRDEIAFLSNRGTNPDGNFHYDIYAVNPQTAEERKLSSAVGVAFSPVWSPDGNSIVYLATTRKITTIDSMAEDTHVWVLGRDGGPGRMVSGKLDRRASSPEWSSDSQTVYFLAGNLGETDIFQASTKEETPHVVVQGPATIRAFSVRGTNLSFTRSDDVTPMEVWIAGVDGSNPHPLSSINSDVAGRWKLAVPQTFWFTSFDHTRVQGWLMPPLNFSQDRKYPLILTIHGGPHGMYGYGFDLTNQIEASHGYAILYINPRGSSGYGQAFSDGCVNDWGGGDYKDLMIGLDYALAHNSWIDPERMGIMGLSYGGYMTNWAVTQTQRFKAAVAMGSLSNLVSFYGTSIYQDLIHAEFAGMPWDADNYQKLWKHSPLAYVKNVTTPVLFIHGEQDNDVPITEAEQMYTALKRREVEAVLLRYPREGHVLHEPVHRYDQINRILVWFDHYLQPESQ
jgi:dipeptidyl aminopeptidase/acylaminoacyl peptidase